MSDRPRSPRTLEELDALLEKGMAQIHAGEVEDIDDVIADIEKIIKRDPQTDKS